MKTFLRQLLECFLEGAVDDALEKQVEVVVIGGSAAALRTRGHGSGCAASEERGGGRT